MIRVVLRADADRLMGVGHVMRCVALGQSLVAANADVMIATSCNDPKILRHIKRSGLGLHLLDAALPRSRDFAGVKALIDGYRSPVVVVDGYHFPQSDFAELRAAGARTVVIDDEPRSGMYDADVLLDQNIGALRQNYVVRQDARLLLGSRFVLLRPEFSNIDRAPRAADGPVRVLIAMGGGDRLNMTALALEAVAMISHGLSVTVLVGAANPHAEALKHAFGGGKIRFVENTPDVAAEMAAADVAVATVGGTVWELAAAGVPALVISTTPTQHRLAESLHQYGAHRWVGDAILLVRERLADSLSELVDSAELRTEMARLGRTLVDGRGAARAASAILDANSEWRFRPAAPEDAEPVWEIASDATVRAESFKADVFGFTSHERWFSERLTRPTQRMWVAERDSSIGAYIRYDASPPWAMVNIAVATPLRGRGLARRLLTATWSDACHALGARAARGVVFETNMASTRAFERAGFSAIDRPSLDGQRCIMFERSVDRQAVS